MVDYIQKSVYCYKNYLVQELDSNSDIIIRDGAGQIIGEVPTFDEAKEFIDECSAG